jgi:hypothetical protein
VTEQPRDFPLEARLTGLAAQAAGFTRAGHNGVEGDDAGLGAFADDRAFTGPIFLAHRETGEPRDFVREIQEELADGRNYAVWRISMLYERVEAGDADALDEYDRLMRCLSHTVAAWHALRY